MGMDAFLQILSAAIGTLGFAFVFNIRGKKVFFAAFGGCLGWVLFLLFGLFLEVGEGDEVGAVPAVEEQGIGGIAVTA